MPTTKRQFEVAVIGGGLVGTAAAFGLAGLGIRTALLDEGDIAFRAARGNTSLVWVQGKGAKLPAYTSWTIEAARAWPEFAAELKAESGVDVNYKQNGGLKFCLSDEEFEKRRTLIAGIDEKAGTEMLTRPALLEIYPGLGPDVVGASFNSIDGQVNSLLLLKALHAGFQNRGGHYLPNHGVEEIRFDQGAHVLLAGRDEIRADKILLAAGIANAQLADKVGLYGGVKPIRGQVLVSEKLKPCLPIPATDLIQTDAGGLLIGNVEEEVGCDDSTNLEVLSNMARRAIATLPFLEAVQIVRAWGALRVMTEDGSPVYQQANQNHAAFCAATHSGVTLASLHASKLAQWVSGKQQDDGLAAFHPERFNVH
jgi:hydrogen cyanide synthase HcnC